MLESSSCSKCIIFSGTQKARSSGKIMIFPHVQSRIFAKTHCRRQFDELHEQHVHHVRPNCLFPHANADMEKRRCGVLMQITLDHFLKEKHVVVSKQASGILRVDRM